MSGALPPGEFAHVCEALRGPCWQRAIAPELGREERMIRYYASGEKPIPDDVREKLRVLCEHRATLLVKLARKLERD